MKNKTIESPVEKAHKEFSKLALYDKGASRMKYNIRYKGEFKCANDPAELFQWFFGKWKVVNNYNN